MTPHVSITLLRTQTDERLLELIAAGHDRAFDAIVDRYRRPLMRYARRFVREDERAEDVVQAAFVSAWGALQDGAPVRDLRPWLYRIVHNGALNVMKKPGGDDAQLIEASDLRPGPAMEVEQREDVRQALDTIAGLPDRQRAALLAVAFEGRSHADVGEELGLNDTAVRQLVSRARATLRVAATAITPWPAAVWLAGLGGAQVATTATTVGEIAGGVGAGTIFGGSALKAGALVAAAGAVAVSAPQVSHVVRPQQRPAAAQAASRPASDATPAGTAGPTTRLVSAPASTPLVRTPTETATGHRRSPSKRAGTPVAGGDGRHGDHRGPGGRAPRDDARRGAPPPARHDLGDDDGPSEDAPVVRRERHGSGGDGRHGERRSESREAEGPEAPEAAEPPKAPESAEHEDRPSGSSDASETSGSHSGSDEPRSGDDHPSDPAPAIAPAP